MSENETLNRKKGWPVIVMAIVVAILLIYSMCFTVQEGTAKVVKSLGRITKVESTPALKFKYPWPFEAVVTVDTRMRLLDVKAKEVLTNDRFNVLVPISVGWAVNDPKTFVTRFPSESKAIEMLTSKVADARERVIKKAKLGDIISTDPSQKKNFTAFEDAIRDHLNLELKSAGYGMEVTMLCARSISFPKDVTQQIFARMKNERERVSKDLRSQGENIAKQIKQDAETKRQKLIADAESKARIIRGEGDAEAAKHYKVFKENPDLANFLRRCDALTMILQERSTVVLTPENEPFTILQQQPPKAGK